MGKRQMIRRAEGRDLPEMVRMAAQFVGEAHPDAPVDATYLDGSFRAMLASGSHLVLVLYVDRPRASGRHGGAADAARLRIVGGRHRLHSGQHDGASGAILRSALRPLRLSTRRN